MSEPQRYHAQNPLDPKAAPGIMYPGKHGEWVRFEDYERMVRGLQEVIARLKGEQS